MDVGVVVVGVGGGFDGNAPSPADPVPADGVEPVDGVLPDLGFVAACCDARQSCLNLLPYVGPGWYLKALLASSAKLLPSNRLQSVLFEPSPSTKTNNNINKDLKFLPA